MLAFDTLFKDILKLAGAAMASVLRKFGSSLPTSVAAFRLAGTGDCAAGMGCYRTVLNTYTPIWRNQNFADYTASNIVLPIARERIGRQLVEEHNRVKAGLRDRTS